ncbi:MAG: hypothetical protein ACYDAP_04235 [Thermoplasmataceae archaeon]
MTFSEIKDEFTDGTVIHGELEELKVVRQKIDDAKHPQANLIGLMEKEWLLRRNWERLKRN